MHPGTLQTHPVAASSGLRSAQARGKKTFDKNAKKAFRQSIGMTCIEGKGSAAAADSHRSPTRMRELTLALPVGLSAENFWSLRSDTGFDDWFAKQDKQTFELVYESKVCLPLTHTHSRKRKR